jgi:hypothetical protein
MLSPRSIRRIAAVAALLALLALAGLSVGVRAYLRSDAFRKLVSEQTSAFFQLEGEYQPLRWSGFSVYSDGYLARRADGTSLRAEQIRADIYPRGLLNRAWLIEDLDVQRIEVVLAPGTSPAPPTREVTPGRVSVWVPNRLDLRRVRIHEANVDWPTGSLRLVRAVIEPDGNAWNLTGTGGRLTQKGWPLLDVEQIRGRYRSPELFITDSQCRLDEAGTVRVTGRVDFRDPMTLDLVVAAGRVPVTPFLPEDWRARLKGNATVEARVTGSKSVTATGKIALASGQLEALPVLDRIAAFTQTAQFRSLTLQKATADFAWCAQTLTVTNLVMESEGLLRVEGGCVVAQGNLTGEFQVGVTPTSLRWLPGSQARVFAVERAGYVWTPVRVTGPVDRLQEDLSARLLAAGGAEIMEGVTGTMRKGAEQLLDLLKPLAP